MSSNQKKQAQMSYPPPQQTNQVSQAPTEAVAQPTDAMDSTTGWKTHTNTEGKYSIQYPQDWVVEIFKEKYPYNTSYDKGNIIFQTRATTAKEKADDAPGLPVDMGTGSVKIITSHFMGGKKYSDMTEQEFFNTNGQLWPKGDIGGGGPGYTYSVAQETTVGNKRAIKQTSHPTKPYEWVGPQQITTTYYVWLGNSSHEVVEISFTYDDTNPNKTLFLQNFNKMVQTFKLLP